MNRNPNGFWQQVYHLREMGIIGRIWKTAQLNEYLERPRGQYAASTIAVRPHNSSVSRKGDRIGDFVSKGQSPKVWRVGRGLFQLVEDPDDDQETQHGQMRLAIARAEELREMKKRTATKHSQIASTSQPSYVAQPKPETVSPGIHSLVPIALTEDGRQEVEDISTEQKALAIVCEHLKTVHGADVIIEEDMDGVDLRVTIDGKTERIEVKGTKDSDITWQKLKVSSKKCHDALVSGDAKIYRVVDVDSANPRVHILIYGEDFTLEPEPRWAIKRIPPDNERYPLLGKPYRYERPHDPVALDDWEILK